MKIAAKTGGSKLGGSKVGAAMAFKNLLEDLS